MLSAHDCPAYQSYSPISTHATSLTLGKCRQKCLSSKPSASPTQRVQRFKKHPCPSSSARESVGAGFHLQVFASHHPKSNFQYIRSLCSSGADDKGKVSGSQRTVCTQQPVMQKRSSSCKIDSDTSRNSHQISSLSEWIINTSDPIIQVLSVFQLPNQTIQLHT